MNRLRRRPVSRGKVLAGALAGLLALAALVAATEALRPGTGPYGPITPQLDADPRVPVDCPEPPAREGRRPRPERVGAAERVSSTQLLDCPTSWDGRRVRFVGEVVGGVLQRRTWAWLQVNDDAYAGELGQLPTHRTLRGANAGVGVRIPLTLVPQIGSVGGPGHRGDLVEVVGVYHRVDEASREVAVIVADRMRVTEAGGPVPRPVDPVRATAAGLLGTLAAALLALQWWARVRRFR